MMDQILRQHFIAFTTTMFPDMLTCSTCDTALYWYDKLTTYTGPNLHIVKCLLGYGYNLKST